MSVKTPDAPEEIMWQGRFIVAKKRGTWEYVGRARKAEEEAQLRVQGNAKKWADMGIFSKHLLGTPDSLLDAHGVYLQDLYVHRTRAEGWLFAKALLMPTCSSSSSARNSPSATALQCQVRKSFAVKSPPLANRR